MMTLMVAIANANAYGDVKRERRRNKKLFLKWVKVSYKRD